MTSRGYDADDNDCNKANELPVSQLTIITFNESIRKSSENEN